MLLFLLFLLGCQAFPGDLGLLIPKGKTPICKVAMAAYCKNIYKQNTFECGDRCSGEISGTILHSAILDEITSGAVLVVYNPSLQSIVVSYRGTSNVQNAIVDAMFWKSDVDWSVPEFVPTRKSDRMRVHAGFQKMYVNLRLRVLSAAKELADTYPTYQILFTGFSLGGALAIFGAVDFNQSFGMGERISVTTFGQPRTGNLFWADYVMSLPFSERINRIVSIGDPIPQLPPNNLGYHHVGLMYVLSNDILTECKLNSEREGEECIKNFLNTNIQRHFDYYNLSGDC